MIAPVDTIPKVPNTGSQPAVVADFRFHLAACGALCEANSGAWLRQPDREVALAAALAIKQPQVELEHAQPGHA